MAADVMLSVINQLLVQFILYLEECGDVFHFFLKIMKLFFHCVKTCVDCGAKCKVKDLKGI